MEPQEPSEAGAAPARPGGSRGVLIVVLAVVAGLIAYYLLSQPDLGSRIDVAQDDEVYYKGNITEETARKLGETLVELDFFGGENGKTVMVAGEGDVVTITFAVVDGTWEQEESVNAFRAVGSYLADRLFQGKTTVLRLCDANLDVKRVIRDLDPRKQGEGP